MDTHEPRIIARGEWEQDENGDLTYIPRHVTPPLGDPGARAADEAPGAGREGYRSRSDETWDRARRDYLAGESAPTVCDRYGLKLGTFRHRSAHEGWRRSDQPEPEPLDLEAELADGPPDWREMADHALIRLNRAVRRGRAAEAATWLRLHEKLLKHAAAEEAASAPEPTPVPEPWEVAERQMIAIHDIVRDATALLDSDAPDPAAAEALEARLNAVLSRPVSDLSDHLHPVFDDPPPPVSSLSRSDGGGAPDRVKTPFPPGIPSPAFSNPKQ